MKWLWLLITAGLSALALNYEFGDKPDHAHALLCAGVAVAVGLLYAGTLEEK